MKIALHGFRIVETRAGKRIEHFPLRTAKRYELAKCRIMDLCRDRRFKHLPERFFEIWDGITAVMKITVESSGRYHEKDYLLKPRDMIEIQGYERDWDIYTRPRLKNQKTGRDTSDISKWILNANTAPGKNDSEVASTNYSNKVAAEDVVKRYTRWSGNHRDNFSLGKQFETPGADRERMNSLVLKKTEI